MTLEDAFNPKCIEKIKHSNFEFNILEWLHSSDNQELQKFRRETYIKFEILGNKRKVLEDAYTRYGSDLAGLVKLIQRTNYSPIFEASSAASSLSNLGSSQSQFWKSL
jgi:hypothetical protein